jgi:hypothetical protein
VRGQIRIDGFVRRDMLRRFAAGYPRKNGVKLSDAFGKRGRTGLQDVSRFHLVDVAVTYGGNILPTFAGSNLFFADFAATPGSDNHFRIGRDYGSGLDNSFPGGVLLAQFGEDRLSAGNLNQFINPADSAD